MAKSKDIKFQRLFPILLKAEFLEYAYNKIVGNKGSKTAGVDGNTKFDLEDPLIRREVFQQIINELAIQSYTPLPVKRTEIPKKNSKKKRPLGIPTFKDRIVQSAIKLILEAIYEPIFLENSHGFRPKRSCQTAIHNIICRKFDWVIEGDIKGCFDNIGHSKLIKLLRNRIADEKFINIINKFLKSGYQMGYGTDGKYPIYFTDKGTPQGGIISPILANIYLHEFDKFMENFLCNMERAKQSKEYIFYSNKIQRIQKAINNNKTPYKITEAPLEEDKEFNFPVNSKEEAAIRIEEIKQARKLEEYQGLRYKKLSNIITSIKKHLKDNKPFPMQPRLSRSKGQVVFLQSKEEMINRLKQYKKLRAKVSLYDKEDYFSNKSIGYVRYADDFVILLGNCSKRETNELKRIITEWFNSELSLSLSKEKTLVTHSTKGFRFLGYDIIQRTKHDGIGYKDDFAKVYVPREKCKLLEEKIDELLRVHYDYPLFDLIIRLNRIINGWSNYYKICNNWSFISNTLDHRLHWIIMHWLGRKHKCKISEVYDKYVVNDFIVYGTKKQRIVDNVGERTVALRKFFDYKFTSTKDMNDKIKGLNDDSSLFNTALDLLHIRTEIAKIQKGYSPSEFYRVAEKDGYCCSRCGRDDTNLVVHHNRLVKRHSKKDSRAIAQATQAISKILVCETCHDELHPNTKTINQ
ncbi:reverse transcriptase domain-containing protein [Metabacillus fastidiosus]|uniref:Reverse transcriptase domain-containing protein n=1 Tax=Metabacillus fastidiosus TaxID=1458 RepID=A0ABU6NV75_9BACI|nr:reverse transcriptase domain-containing protein [Metabacillus fastidiosus]